MKIFMFVSAILVFASTVLIKQHVVIDIIGGVLVVEIGLFLAKKLNTKRTCSGFDNMRIIAEPRYDLGRENVTDNRTDS